MASTSDSDPEIDKSLKRKRVAEEPKLSKRAQKRRRAKHQYDDEEIDDDTGVNLTIGRMNPDLLADYVAKKTKRFEDQATPVELEDRRVPGKSAVPVGSSLLYLTLRPDTNSIQLSIHSQCL